MQYMPSLKSSLTQAIQLLVIFIYSFLLLEEFINKFCHKFANLNRLKRRLL